MSYIRHISTSRAGAETHVTGISDVVVHDTGRGLVSYSASGRDGGILVRDASLRVIDTADYRAAGGLGAPAQLHVTQIGGRDALLVSGPAQAGLSGYWLDGSGRITTRFDMAGPRVEALTALEMVEVGGQEYWFTAARGTAGITTWQQASGNRLVETAQVNVALQEAGNDIFALEHVQAGGRDYLMAVSAQGDGLHNFQLGADGVARLVDSIDMRSGLGVDTPTHLSQLAFGGQAFVLVGSAGTSSVTVVAVAGNGSLRATDQVNDDLNTRFQSLSILESIVVDGRGYVLAGGADDGLTLMALLPTGRLVQLQTIADDLSTALTNPAAATLVEEDGMIVLYTAGLSDDAYGASGTGRFEIDPNGGGTSGQVLRGGAGADQLTGGAGADQIIGGGGDDRLQGGGGADIIVDGGGSDRMWGGAGADIFVLAGDGANDTIEDFELGVDRIDMSAMGRFYTIEALEFDSTRDGARLSINGETLILKTDDNSRLRPEDMQYDDLTGLWHISTAALPLGDQQLIGTTGRDMILGAEGADTIAGSSGADTIHGGSGNDMLIGGIFDAEFDPLAATVYRLYRATLDRAPDAGGHRGWIDILSQGQRDLRDVAGGFVNSGEFARTYGATSDAGFVTLLYNNVLDRAPDAGGLRGWTDVLANGASRAQVVVGFSESAEFKASTAAGAVKLSFEGYRNDWLDDVYRLYRATLDRDPDQAGLEGWAGRLAGGDAIAQVAGGFTGSREFREVYGDLGDRAFVQLLYRNVLERGADAGGLSGWLDVLAGGASRGDVVAGFSQSREFSANTAPAVAAWVRAQGWEDVLEGGSGANVLFGGMWADSFVFQVAQGGSHTVVDLESWDQLCFEDFGYEDAADVRAHLRQDGDDVVFTDQGVEVRLMDTDLAFLRDDNLFDV
ncbi:DUF4214 domain-containing protein [uncultured Sulfitobacter sp.]|uniref:DUF4214 domain-containing protein n=1 Tax=uncultured Sulfitobacter sp. TaxID=191468 RepID=UPI002636CD45|nr:DUF4214 domain-containing protein [uncultured Sulfitobacter sp.]